MLVTFRTVKGDSFQLELEEDATVCVLLSIYIQVILKEKV